LATGGDAANGYELINKDGLKAAYDLTAASYLLKATGDKFNFVSGTGTANSDKFQLRNLTTATGSSQYICDKSGFGLQATNYSRNDGGNWLYFIPQISTFIPPVEAVSDPIVSSVYYNLQGIRVQQPAPGNFYIRIDTHVSRKTTATKIFQVNK
jgi:hypothetical protein